MTEAQRKYYLALRKTGVRAKDAFEAANYKAETLAGLLANLMLRPVLKTALQQGLSTIAYEALRHNWHNRGDAMKLNNFAPKLLCAPRKRFSTEQAARAAAFRAQRLVEPCHHCNGWHLK